jgi:hypothetical protein
LLRGIVVVALFVSDSDGSGFVGALMATSAMAAPAKKVLGLAKIWLASENTSWQSVGGNAERNADGMGINDSRRWCEFSTLKRAVLVNSSEVKQRCCRLGE